MNTKSSPKRKFKISSWLIIAILFIAIIGILLWIKRTLTEYNDLAYNQCVQSQLDTFDSILDEAISSGKYGIEDSTKRLNDELEYLDKEKLEKCLTTGEIPYQEFDDLLRDNYQTNIYLQGTEMNENRNSIFVLCNERVIASYTHDDTFYTDPARINTKLNIRDMIEENAYNKLLSLHALDQIEKQQIQDLMIWQVREPSQVDLPMYETVTRETLREIFKKYGLKGLESFDILIPTYITKYGNVFGESDVPGLKDYTSNNKIIVVQKLNIADYINYHFPEAFNTEQLTILSKQSEFYSNYVNILIILECIMIIALGFSFVTYYNHILIEDEYEDAISNKEQK